MKFYRGKLLDYVNLKVRDLNRSREFYKSIIESLGHTLSAEENTFFTIDELMVTEDPTVSQSIHLAFQATSPASVKLFYKTALQHGGMPKGEPGEIGQHIGHYSAFVLDPDGNIIEAVYHGPLSRSVPNHEIYPSRSLGA
jgi:predicted lactoylglutathione lyase